MTDGCHDKGLQVKYTLICVVLGRGLSLGGNVRIGVAMCDNVWQCAIGGAMFSGNEVLGKCVLCGNMRGGAGKILLMTAFSN